MANQTLWKRRTGSGGIPASVAPGEPIVNTFDTSAWVGSNTAGSPFQIALGLQVQNNTFRYAVSTGSANAYVLTLAPALTALVAGQSVVFKANFTCTGASTLAVNGLTATALTKLGVAALVSGDITSGNIVVAYYDGTQFQITCNIGLVNVAHGGTGAVTLSGILRGNGTSAVVSAIDGSDFMSPVKIQNQTATYIASTGSANAYVATPSPPYGALTEGQCITFKANFANTGPATLAVSGQAAKAITKVGNTALVTGDILIGDLVTVMYDGTQWQMVSGAAVEIVARGGTGAITLTGIVTGNGAAAMTAFTPTLYQANGDNSTTAFNTGHTFAFGAAILVFVGGATQRLTTDYTFAGTTVTFGIAPPTGTNNVQVWGI